MCRVTPVLFLAMTSLRVSKQLFNPGLYTGVRTLWFDGVPADSTYPPEIATKRWFGFGSPEEKARFDGQCRGNFSDALDSLGPANWPLLPASGWAAERETDDAVAAPLLSDSESFPAGGDGKALAENAIGLVLLLDQIPRNAFREEQAVIYSHYDRIARSVLYELLKLSPRPDLHPSIRYSAAFRSWLYMPLMHSEYLEDHHKYSELMAGFKADVDLKGDAVCAGIIDQYLIFEKKHVSIIERFGRYPHRNEYLRRESTMEEREFMDGGGDTFGTKKGQNERKG
jgi:uncharacterized protein (DUF924 family)